MNFDFLSNSKQLNKLYEYSFDAERFALGLPNYSASRARCALEFILKLLYRTSHRYISTNELCKNLTPNDILKDKTFRDFISNKEVIDSFYKVKKIGNEASHGVDINSLEALDAIKSLHFAIGESCILLGEIDNYPKFEESCLKVVTIVDEYVTDESVDVDSDIVNYYVTCLMPKLNNFCNRRAFEMPVEICEYIKFENRPQNVNIIRTIERYYYDLILQYEDNNGTDFDIEYFDIIIKVDNKTIGFNNIDKIKHELKNLRNYSSFEIKSTFTGDYSPFEISTLVASGINEIWFKGLYDYLHGIMNFADFTYKNTSVLRDSGEISINKIENGKEIDPFMHESGKLIDNENYCWYNTVFNIFLSMDNDKNETIRIRLHSIVEEFLSDDDVQYCLDYWKEEDENIGDYGLDGDAFALFVDVQCLPNKSLREIQNMLDKINIELDKIEGEYELSTDSVWFDGNNFAVARVVDTNNHLQIVGCDF